jgi:hypothetical protein
MKLKARDIQTSMILGNDKGHYNIITQKKRRK